MFVFDAKGDPKGRFTSQQLDAAGAALEELVALAKQEL